VRVEHRLNRPDGMAREMEESGIGKGLKSTTEAFAGQDSPWTLVDADAVPHEVEQEVEGLRAGPPAVLLKPRKGVAELLRPLAPELELGNCAKESRSIAGRVSPSIGPLGLLVVKQRTQSDGQKQIQLWEPVQGRMLAQHRANDRRK
jgi:hypothetical protein